MKKERYPNVLVFLSPIEYSSGKITDFWIARNLDLDRPPTNFNINLSHPGQKSQKFQCKYILHSDLVKLLLYFKL